MRTNTSIVLTTFIISILSCNNQQSKENLNNKQKDSSSQTKSEITTSVSKKEQEIKYLNYCNARFGFCVDYPSDILYPQGESENGDGQIFKSKDAENELSVYRDYSDMIDGDNQFEIDQAYENDSKGNNQDNPKKVITYKKLGNNYYVVSGFNDGKIFYQKTIYSNNELKTCLLTYKESERQFYDKISEHIFKSFK